LRHAPADRQPWFETPYPSAEDRLGWAAFQLKLLLKLVFKVWRWMA
jgi:hypothetical protein